MLKASERVKKHLMRCPGSFLSSIGPLHGIPSIECFDHVHWIVNAYELSC